MLGMAKAGRLMARQMRQQTWDQLSHAIWAKTGESVSEYVAPNPIVMFDCDFEVVQKNYPPGGQVARFSHHRGHH